MALLWLHGGTRQPHNVSPLRWASGCGWAATVRSSDKLLQLRRQFSPCEESYRLCPLYQCQLVNEDVIVFDKLPQLGIGFVTIILGPAPPHEGIRCDGVDKKIGGLLAQVTKKARPVVLLCH